MPLTHAPVAVLLDADGTLFPSEEPAFEAATEVLNALLAELGRDERYEADGLRRVASGRNFRGIASDIAGEDLSPGQLEAWVVRERDAVIAHLGAVLRPDAEVRDAVAALPGEVAPAVVSSSALARLDACFRATGLDALLPAGRRYSAEDSLPAPRSKPDPAVYVFAAEDLGVPAARCLAVEDAASGVASSVAAGIPVVGLLHFVGEDEREDRRAELTAAGAFAVADRWPDLLALLS